MSVRRGISEQRAASSKQPLAVWVGLDQPIQDAPEFCHLFIERCGVQPPPGCSLEPVLGLQERSTCDQEMPALIGERSAAQSFSDIRADRVGRTNELNSHGPQLELVQQRHARVDVIGQRGGQSVGAERSMSTSGHPTSMQGRSKLRPLAARCLLLAAC